MDVTRTLFVHGPLEPPTDLLKLAAVPDSIPPSPRGLAAGFVTGDASRARIAP